MNRAAIAAGLAAENSSPDLSCHVLIANLAVDWYLKRVEQAAEAAKRATDGAPMTLLCHSAGGWLGR
jgi:hypothetical protein